MNKLQKIISLALVIAMLAVGGAVFAQDEATSENEPVCSELRPERGEHPIKAALDELGITREDVQAYIEAGGTMEEFLAENGIDVEAMRAEKEAEREAAMLACVDELEANGTISSEQAVQLRDALAEGTLRELLQSGEFDDVFPRLGQRGDGEEGRRGRGHRGRGHGQGFGDGFGGNGQ